MPTIFVIVVILSLLFTIYVSKTNHKSAKLSKEFWDKEINSNSTRKADVSNLDYIKIPIEHLPFTESEDNELVRIQNIIRDLSSKPILNLTGISNTDLKLKYGASNITHLSECDNNYTLLVRNLYSWGAYLIERGKKQDAITVLEYAVQCKTDISKNYTLLATIYKDIHKDEKIDDLLLTAITLRSLSKNSIVDSLKEIQH